MDEIEGISTIITKEGQVSVQTSALIEFVFNLALEELRNQAYVNLRNISDPDGTYNPFDDDDAYNDIANEIPEFVQQIKTMHEIKAFLLEQTDSALSHDTIEHDCAINIFPWDHERFNIKP